MAAEAEVWVRSLVPWLSGAARGERTRFVISPGETRARDVLDLLGVTGAAARDALLIVVDGTTVPWHTVLHGGEEITILAAVSGGAPAR